MLHLYIQHTASRLEAPLTGLSKTSETPLDSHHKVACPRHLLCDKCYMLHRVDSLHPLIACQTPPLLQLTYDQHQYRDSMINITYTDKTADLTTGSSRGAIYTKGRCAHTAVLGTWQLCMPRPAAEPTLCKKGVFQVIGGAGVGPRRVCHGCMLPPGLLEFQYWRARMQQVLIVHSHHVCMPAVAATHIRLAWIPNSELQTPAVVIGIVFTTHTCTCHSTNPNQH